MNKKLLFILFLGSIGKLLIDFGDAAEIVDQLIGVYVGTPEEYPLCNYTSRMKRVNKTHQSFVSDWEVKQFFTDEHYVDFYIYREDGGGWHPFMQRNGFRKPCSALFKKGGMAYGVKRSFAPDFPEECPVKPGFYSNMSNMIIPRYRREWSPEMQALIPPMLPSSAKWRVDVKVFDGKDELVSLMRLDFRLINQFSSQ